MTPPNPPQSDERGAALLSVLLLVAVMAVISATALDRLNLATRLTGRTAAVDQGRAFVLAAEEMALGRVASLMARDSSRLTLASGWLDKEFALPLPHARGTARLIDASNCFNLNGLVSETAPDRFTQRGGTVMQFAALMELLGIPKGQAQEIASATADYIDSDDMVSPLGAEDAAYRGVGGGYLAANHLLGDKSEWRAVRGVTPAIYARMAPWICVLPHAEPLRLNVNTLRADQAALIAMLMPQEISMAAVRAALAARPADGYGSADQFWSRASLAGIRPRYDGINQIGVTSRWLLLEIDVEMGDSVVGAASLVDAYGGAMAANEAPPAIVARKWGAWD